MHLLWATWKNGNGCMDFARIVKSSSACVWNIRQIDKYLLFIWLLYQLTLKWPQFFSPSFDDYNIIKYHNKHGHITHSLAHCKNVKRYWSFNRIFCLMGPKLSFVVINNLIMLEWNVTDWLHATFVTTCYILVLCSAPSVPQLVVQSQRRPLLGHSPGWKRLLALSHLRHY